MKYEKMSDFEINKAVAEALGLKLSKGQQFGDADLSIVRLEPGEGGPVDYCKRWSDAGPIIEKNLICIAADVFAEPHDGGKWVAQPALGWEFERVRSDNPLRAAMIVFLMQVKK